MIDEFGEVKKAEVFILADNFVPKPGKFIAEYGFSAFLKIYGDEEIGVLLDTGAGYAIEHNWEQFSLCWDEVNYIVLSHRHFDHTGGLLKVLDKTNAPIIAHPNLFKPSFLWVRGRFVDGSLPFPESLIREKARIYMIRDPLKIAPGVVISGEIPRVTDFEKSPETFSLEDGRFVNDRMDDDMAVFIKTKKGLSIITGCAHSGVVNTVKRGMELSGESPFMVAGGFHLIFADRERIQKTAEELMVAKLIAPTHCSGFGVAGEIVRRDPSKYIPIGAGIRFEI
ncbi:Metal-dependent hydrolases of the beta-lactamase superfamily II [Archaeoglobus sulfaticallidus PM70-1]|uniref:Metal-dependent hydrolases of the beta-lactamase superfamily II n=1 Tax=Archaeoglobus sulfaticallidus PM70-1 TaxID=387631 RepID=N0BD89_9EURY|nr:MBL fold metallo-hydrolase [Archaeoglobus sulfaticallidus]AGK60212.1 Metal-dependent hydrolases of the beta-lactamase superfamily II [Archaeoglobus sulfaticallidus PM70-1]